MKYDTTTDTATFSAEPDDDDLARPVTEADQAEFDALVRARQAELEAQKQSDAALREADDLSVPLMFLDIDDVLCLNAPWTGDHLLQVLAGHLDKGKAEQVCAEVFSDLPKAVLHVIHLELNGLRYVFSSTWRKHFTREQMQEVLRRTGLGFVADAMYSDVRWATPRDWQGNRLVEITDWLRTYHRGQSFVVIDDDYSGSVLELAGADTSHKLYGRVILCEEGVGLRAGHVEPILVALRTPIREEKAK